MRHTQSKLINASQSKSRQLGGQDRHWYRRLLPHLLALQPIADRIGTSHAEETRTTRIKKNM